MDNLLYDLNEVNSGTKHSGKDTTRGIGARTTNRSITCSEELRNRVRIMAAHEGVPMQELLEKWIKRGLEEGGY